MLQIRRTPLLSLIQLEICPVKSIYMLLAQMQHERPRSTFLSRISRRKNALDLSGSFFFWDTVHFYIEGSNAYMLDYRWV